MWFRHQLISEYESVSTLFIGYGLGIFSAALLLVVALDLRKAPTRRQRH